MASAAVSSIAMAAVDDWREQAGEIVDRIRPPK